MPAPLTGSNQDGPATTQVPSRSPPSITCPQILGCLNHVVDDRARTKLVRGVLLVTLLAAVLVMAGCGSSSAPSSPPPPPPPPPPPATVTVTPATATVYRGETQQFTAKVSGTSNQAVTWSVPVGSIDSTGLYTASSDAGGGTIDVTATSNALPGASGKATVTLPLVNFSIDPNALTIKPGASSTFSATLEGLGNSEVEWSVQGTSGGSITNNGVYTAPSTEGVYYVQATSAAHTHYIATAVVLVTTAPPPFSSTGDMTKKRALHTSTLLSNGKVLVAGGFVYEAYCIAGIDSAELYDPASKSFASAGTMTNRRYGQTSTRLPNGEVLITGGFTYDATTCSDLDPSPALKSAELYDHTQATFHLTGSMAEERGGHTATLLADGTVLLAGGSKEGWGWFPSQFGDGSKAGEIYDPATGVFTTTGSMVAGRVGQTATLLADGKVLIAGGWTSSNAIATAELYDPLTGAFTPTGSMTSARAAHTATLLVDGRVLITGGLLDQTNAGSDSADIYDPVTGSFAATGSMGVARRSHTATLLPNGTVLVVGGGSMVAEIYDPATASFSISGLTEFDRSGHSATLLQNGNVIVIGGFGPLGQLGLATAELYH
jgi:Galactose oxidase, central domain/Bacterial Ig-like domain (group 2)/Kelch motif